ncbi:PIG-M-domain-containing protein [Tribonema minus]|uniref:GPI mannosyltransferase 1 n=1 Tax=Tribonema minus TaxID=303371 RepID=A0A835YRD0_9STRA|nr:PIG-M-domain-containing protein [Tribonema minus]
MNDLPAELLPAVTVHPACGKLLFALADLAVGAAIEGVLRARGVPAAHARQCSALWLFNPVAANVSTRGSCDSITSALVLLAAMFASGPSRSVTAAAALAALPLGLAVHIRLYPVIYAPSFALHLGARWRRERKKNGKERMAARQRQALPMQEHNGEGVAAQQQQALTLRTLKQEEMSPTKARAAPLIEVLKDGLSPPALLFAAAAAATAAGAAAACVRAYGNAYVDHALRYHATRADNRHNFSMYFYWIYLDYEVRWAADVEIRHNFSMYFYWIYLDYESDNRQLLGLAAFLPQALLVVAAALAYARKNLPLCLFLQTAVFVTCNKVCTGQYFIWYMAVLPLLAPSLGLFGPRGPEQTSALRWLCAAGVAWAVALAAWLLQAYRLEFLGHNTFTTLWMASVMMFLANIAVLVGVIHACAAALPPAACDSPRDGGGSCTKKTV